MENQEKHTAKNVVAAILAVFITLLLIADGLLLSLKMGVFKQNTLSGMFEELDIYDDLRGVVDDMIKSGVSNAGIAGLERFDTSRIISDEMMNDIVELVEDSVMNGREADLKSLINKHKDAVVSNFCAEAVDIAIEDVGNVISEQKLESVEWITDFGKQYDLNLSKEIMDCVSESYELNENKELDISNIDKKELSEKIATSIKKEASDKIDQEIDNYLEDINKTLNDMLSTSSGTDSSSQKTQDGSGAVIAGGAKGIGVTASAGGAARRMSAAASGSIAANSEVDLGELMKKATGALNLMSTLIVVFSVVLVLLIVCEILLYLKRGIGWLRNLSICCLVAGCVHIIVFFVANVVKSSLSGTDFGVDSQAVLDLIEKLIDRCVGGLQSVALTIGVVLLAAGVVAMAVFILVSKSGKKKQLATTT